MSETKLGKDQAGRRGFMSLLGKVCATTAVCSTVSRASRAESGAAPRRLPRPLRPAGFPRRARSPGYDWTKHRWAFGVDAERCIGCLRCVEACKVENNVPFNRAEFSHLG